MYCMYINMVAAAIQLELFQVLLLHVHTGKIRRSGQWQGWAFVFIVCEHCQFVFSEVSLKFDY